VCFIGLDSIKTVKFRCNFDHEKAEVVEIQQLPLKLGVQDEDTNMLFNG